MTMTETEKKAVEERTEKDGKVRAWIYKTNERGLPLLLKTKNQIELYEYIRWLEGEVMARLKDPAK